MSDQETIYKIETSPYTSIDKKTSIGTAFSFEILDLIITGAVGGLLELIIQIVQIKWYIGHFDIAPIVVLPILLFVFLVIVVLKFGKPDNYLSDYFKYIFTHKHHFKKEE